MTRISFEFFPPREAKSQRSLVDNVSAKLAEAHPAFFSVTYGAGGSTRTGTFDTVRNLIDAGYECVPHLSIGDDNQSDIAAALERYRECGVHRIVALRGDTPSGTVRRANNPANAEQLVRWIRELSGDAFHIEVAAYPEVHPDARSPQQDLDFFKRKVDAGANSAITQYFYNPHAYYDFVNRCTQAGLDIPIHVGVMPITDLEAIVRFSRNCGADVPRWMVKRMEVLADDAIALRDFAVDAVSRLCQEVLSFGAPGLHFYTLNRWGATRRILTNLSFA